MLLCWWGPLTDRISLVGNIAEGSPISGVSGAGERLVDKGMRMCGGGGERKLNTELVGIQGFFTKLRLHPEHLGQG
jgi:hypothetical protein